MSKRTETMRVTVTAVIQVGTARPVTTGWQAIFQPSDADAKVERNIGDICRLLHDEAQDAARAVSR